MHTAPAEVVDALGYCEYEEAMNQQSTFQNYIDEMEFKHLFFGHYHLDEDIEDVFHCIMDSVLDLDDYK